MSSRQKRVIVPLDDTAREGLAWLSAATGLGEDALAKRLLQAVLNVIAGAMETGELGAEPVAPLSPMGARLRPGDSLIELPDGSVEIVWPIENGPPEPLDDTEFLHEDWGDRG